MAGRSISLCIPEYRIFSSAILGGNHDFVEFGTLLHESWKLKRSLTSKISNSTIDSIYETACRAVAVGGKLLGVGGGEFMLFLVKPEDQPRVRLVLNQLLEVPFQFETGGVRSWCMIRGQSVVNLFLTAKSGGLS